jgi:hypothetical protein
LCVTECLFLFIFKALNRIMINIHLLPWFKASCLAHIEIFIVTAAQRSWAHLMVTQMLCCLCGELKSISWWVRHSSGNVSCQWTVNIFQFEK